MKKLGAKILLVLSLLVVFLAVGSSEVSANQLVEVDVEFRLYTDIADVDNNLSKGGYVSATSSFLVEREERWNGQDQIMNKLKSMAEIELANQTGRNVSISDMVTSQELSTTLRYGVYAQGTRMYINNSMSRDLSFRFYTSNPTLIVNFFGSLNGPLNGWKVYGNTDKRAERYYNNNAFLTGISKVGQTTYLFSSTGAKQYGWHKVNGWQMYFNEQNGGLWTGKRKIGNTTYLFNSQGHKIDGWHRLNGKDYFFNQTNGGMWTGKRKIGQTTYLLHNDGHKIFGWHVDNNGDKYYFDPNFGGGMVTSFRKVGNAHYYFDTTTGAALKNQSRTINGERWYFNNSGVGTRR